jgi:CubicO group peptidase (beta-lactamase class C family)
VPSLPDDVKERLTVRRLLAHATGLVDYRQAAGYREDRPLTREAAVASAAATSDLSSLEVDYAATNYVAVGLLLEDVAGKPLDEILAEEIFEPLELRDTKLVNNDRDGFVGQGSAGVVSTLDDIATWYSALFQRGEVLSPRMLDAMVYGGREFSDDAGLGAWRHCPCRPPTEADPTPWYYAYHDGGDVRVVYLPDEDAVVVVRVSEPLYGAVHVVDSVDGIIGTLAADLPPPPVDAPLARSRVAAER